MTKHNWDDEDVRVSKREMKKKDKSIKCPQCGRETRGTCKECEITIDKRGGWRQLGIYDG